jgi:predicted Zn-dependent peptidase
LIAAQLILEGGAGVEPIELAGGAALLARSLPEGTEVRDAVAFVEATERLGAEIHADAGWETLVGTAEVPRRHLAPSFLLMAEMLLRPALPSHEVDRLREERLNDLRRRPPSLAAVWRACCDSLHPVPTLVSSGR